jgi:hypothetical protein
MNSTSPSSSRRVRFDAESAKFGVENKVQQRLSYGYSKDFEDDEAMKISKRILVLSRERRRSQRSILLEVANDQERLVKLSRKNSGLSFLPSAIEMEKPLPLFF